MCTEWYNHLRAQGLLKDDEHPTYTLMDYALLQKSSVMRELYFLCMAMLLVAGGKNH